MQTPASVLTILFDIDGTLLLTQRAGTRAIDVVFREMFGRDREIELRLHGRTDRGILGELFQSIGEELTDAAFGRFVEAYLVELEKNLRQDPATVLPGVRSLLDWAAEQPTVEVGLLTGNVRQGAMLKLQHTNLAHYFAFGGFGDLHPHRDDVARQAAEAARGQLRERFCPQSVVVVGDTVHDVTCAKSIGAKVVAVLTGGVERSTLQQAGADMVCDDLADGIAVLQHFLKH